LSIVSAFHLRYAAVKDKKLCHSKRECLTAPRCEDVS
jgi:hypothetical protein